MADSSRRQRPFMVKCGYSNSRRRCLMKIRSFALAACAAVAMGGVSTAASKTRDCQTVYSVTDMGTLGCEGAFPESMNNRGAVVGYSCFPGEITPRAFLWSEDDPMMRDLGGFGGAT